MVGAAAPANSSSTSSSSTERSRLQIGRRVTLPSHTAPLGGTLFGCALCSAVLAHIFLKEQLNIFGILGCVLCITGSITIVLHVPAEQPIESVAQVWNLAMQPGEQSAVQLVQYWARECVCVKHRSCKANSCTNAG